MTYLGNFRSYGRNLLGYSCKAESPPEYARESLRMHMGTCLAAAGKAYYRRDSLQVSRSHKLLGRPIQRKLPSPRTKLTRSRALSKSPPPFGRDFFGRQFGEKSNAEIEFP